MAYKIYVAFIFLSVLHACCALTPTTDEGCLAIGGTCQDVGLACHDGRYYEQLCVGGQRYCCAKKTDEAACHRVGGTCDYHCVGAMPMAVPCEGHMSCCVGMK